MVIEATCSKAKLTEFVELSYTKCLGSQAIMQMLDIMRRLIENASKDKANPNFRKIKISNPKILQSVAQYKSNIEFFNEIGF